MTHIIGIGVLCLLFLLHWQASIIGQSILLHRGATHNQFTFTQKKYMHYAYWYLFFSMGPSYLSPRAYALLHRMHHRYADEDLDPHKPTRSFFGPIKMIINTAKPYSDAYRHRDWMRVGDGCIYIRNAHDENIMRWDAFDRIAHSWLMRLGWALVYILVYYQLLVVFQLPLWLLPIVAVHIFMGPIHGMIVNYFAHMYGDSPHSMSNSSRNMPPLVRKLLQLKGELYHNNHHKFPQAPDFSLGQGIDGSYIIMKWLEKRGVININNLHKVAY